MAFDFKNLLLQAGSTAAGIALPGIGAPLFGALAPGILQGLGDAFGISDGGSSATNAATNKAIEDAARIQQAASYTASGAEGAAANRESMMKSRELVNTMSADARRAQQQQQSLGSQALSSGQQMTDLATAQAAQNLGNQRRALMEQAGAGGASAAALAGIAGNLGQSNSQTLGNLLMQGTQAQQQGLQQAGSAFAASEQTRQADLQNRLQMFQPFAMQKFGGTTAGAISSLGDFGAQQAAMRAQEDPLYLLKRMGGQAATNALNEILLNRASNKLGEQGTQGTTSTGTKEGDAIAGLFGRSFGNFVSGTRNVR